MVFLHFFGLLFIITAASTIISYTSENLSKRYGVNLIGSIFLALIGTLPEYMFVIWASMKGNYEVAIGSTIGACSLLITLGYGFVILISTSKISKKPVKEISLSHQTHIDSIYLGVTAIIALFLVLEGNGLDLKDSIILIGLFFLYVIQVVSHSFQHKWEMENDGEKCNPTRDFLGLAVGAITIFFASGPFVDVMIELSYLLKMNPITIAIIIGPIASEIPEKLTAYITVIRNGSLAEISICNFIGTKVNHNSLLIGTLALIGFLKGDSPITGMFGIPFLLMTGLTLVATCNLLRKKLTKWQGIFFLFSYFLVLFVAIRVPFKGH